MTDKKQKVINYLVKKGATKESSERCVNEHYDNVIEWAWNSTPAKLAEIIMAL